MTTITKERIELFVKSPLENGLTRGEQMELARIALASLEAEKGADPVVFTDERNLRHIARGRETSLIWGKQNQEVGDIPLYRHAQPVPVDKEFIPKNLDKALGVVGVALPESKEELNFQTERWIQRLIDRVIRYADEFKEHPAPVVPEECPAELPYAQVNAVADLYALCWQSGEVVTYTPDPEKATIWINNYSGTCVQEYVKLERLQEALAGNSPVILDGYALVPVEPTPEMREAFHVANEEYESGSYDVWKPDHQWQAMLAAAPQLKIALASIERCQAGFDAKHALFEVAIARFSKMNEGFPIKRFKADWVISWMLENFPPVAQKQGDN
ncbi:TPA: DUF551 domain-containing protein [Salmonella enterica]|uniref:DUF551 domain-containing protein n=1 Tax=unclassified Salmonella TaxID=2614656 RepID=UPI0020C6D799|nr:MULTISPECIES: DUF551 domain-containing protein [unclassified Salmonella]